MKIQSHENTENMKIQKKGTKMHTKIFPLYFYIQPRKVSAILPLAS